MTIVIDAKYRIDLGVTITAAVVSAYHAFAVAWYRSSFLDLLLLHHVVN